MMNLDELQNKVDSWIQMYGVRYFDVLTNTLLLNEEVGEFTSLVARQYGEQSFKKKISEKIVYENLEDEIGDILFVLTCLANQMEFSLEQIVTKNLDKKKIRDKLRHKKNVKLKSCGE